ncbi:general stress protein [Priestia megaterium]|uniref:general stress protein n=1 Tax=Priestia megaterium TaxID=1404 RepID=UPI000BFE28F6|nr:general stress protein [Priestia megaterium]NGY75156.1 general stress protein [Priestia megaterium]PGN64303.1 general stress protein [Priestia megaterium]
MKHIEIAENQEEATCIIHSFLKKGFTNKDIYLLAYDKEWAQNLTEATHTKKYRMAEQGIFETAVNMLLSREDELLSKMASLGLSNQEANRYKEEMKQGHIVVIGAQSQSIPY